MHLNKSLRILNNYNESCIPQSLTTGFHVENQVSKRGDGWGLLRMDHSKIMKINLILNVMLYEILIDLIFRS